MLLKISSNNLEINNGCNEIYTGKIERLIKGCTELNTRRFFDFTENVVKYQIGSLDCHSVCICNNCGNCCSFYCGCCEKNKRYLFKIILDNNLNQCGEFNYVIKNQCSNEDFYEIKFPNDANVLMKLLILGGLFDAVLFPYDSYPDNERSVNASKKKLNILFFILFAIIYIILIRIFFY